jgi:dinuclear metal center YbgI/SA1388 family protein
MKRNDLVRHLNELLRVKDIKDSSRNGLQVEGAGEVRRVALAVDACLDAYRLAAAARCQMVIAHHGLIWDGLRSISGVQGRHVKYLLEHDLNLYGSHLPLDVHDELGNNARLAKMMGLESRERFGLYSETLISFKGVLPRPATAVELARTLQRRTGGRPMLLPFGKARNRTVGICSGGGSDLLGQAIEQGLDCYVTGEASHFTHHLAKEGGINVIFLGHYHSEKCGVQALGHHLVKTFGVEVEFLDVPTLV